MALLSIQLTDAPESVNPAPPPDAEATNTPVNANQAQGTPAPLDTVTLASQTAQGQGTAENSQDGQLQNSPLVPGGTGSTGKPAADSQNGNVPAGTQVPTPQQTKSNASTLSLGTASAAGQPDPAQTQQQELQQLDAILLQLGINPQSISVFSQLALLSYANNPSALQQFVQQFQQTAQVLQQGTTASSASQNESQAESPGSTEAAPVSQATQTASPATGQATSATSQETATALQFQELQSAVEAVGGQVQLPSNSSAASSAGGSLNVTI